MLLLFAGVWGRVLYLQTVKAEELRELSARYGGLRKRTWTVYGMRGTIRDRHGNVLAMDVMSLSVYIRPKAVTEVKQVAQQLAPVIGSSPQQLEHKILQWRQRIEQAHAAQRAVPTAFTLERELVGERASRLREAVQQERARLREVMKQTARSPRPVRLTSWLDGVDIVEEPRRQYPYGSIASALIGFANREGQGQAGLELLLNKRLSPTHGTVEGVLGAAGQIAVGTRHVVTAPRNGEEVRLTIDVNIQSIAEECLQEVLRKHQPAGACAIVMDVHQGDLLAVANAPSIDLNRWQEEVSQRGLGVMRNLATMALFEPGSTFKPIVIAEAMQAGVVGQGSRFYCPGSLKVGKHTIRCAPHGGRRAHGSQTLEEVVAHSCNVATAQIGMRLGAHALYEGVQRFGLLDKPLPGAERGRLDRPEGWQKIRLANVAFGQGVQVTPIALAAAYAAIANDGVYVKPRLLWNEPVHTQQVLAPEVAARMRQYLQAVVDEGTGKLARVRGYTVAGKTGTAQKVVPGRRGYAAGKYVASFVGFAPAEQPRIVVLVMVDEPRNGHYGGVVAAPAFARITERVLAYLGVPAETDEQKLVSLSGR